MKTTDFLPFADKFILLSVNSYWKLRIMDVANEAGVSKSTVSKVLNNWSTISPATVARVQEAIKKLNYTPNSRAVIFARQSTRNIIYLTSLAPNTAYENPHMFDIMCGVHHELSKNGFTLTLVDTSEEKYPGERALSEINRRSADGLIIHGSAVTEELANVITREFFPHIIIGHPEFNEHLCWIDTSHYLAGEYAATHLLACGYTDIVFITGRKNDTISSQRMKGFKRKMLDCGYHIPNENLWYTTTTKQNAYETTYSRLKSCIENPNRTLPQAILCENSSLALGIIRAIRELSLSIPEDIAFIGFDKYPYVGIMDPTPTVVYIDVYDLGVQAGHMMVRKLENPELLIQSYTTLPRILQGNSTIPKSYRI